MSQVVLVDLLVNVVQVALLDMLLDAALVALLDVLFDFLIPTSCLDELFSSLFLAR